MSNILYDWDDYINRYADLQKTNILTKEKAIDHWIKYGVHENMILKLIDNDFNWITYVENYKDLQDANIDTYDKAFNHWISWGKNEGRTYIRLSTNTNNKILLIFALHTNDDLKYKTLINNIKYFEKDFIDIILINTAEYENKYDYNISSNIIDSIYITNDKYCDFGKWTWVLKNKMVVNKYKKIIFTNDSYIMVNEINEYLNNVLNLDLDLYAYNDSSEIKYHYQSYLFSIDSSKIHNFINIYSNYSIFVNSFYDLIIKFELNLINYFDKKNCYLKIAHDTKGNNIFFARDDIYRKIISDKLPFIKIKRLYFVNKNNIIVPNFIAELLKNKKIL